MSMRLTKIKPFLVFAADMLAFFVGVTVVIILSATNAIPSQYFMGFLKYYSLIAACLFAVTICVDFFAMFAIKTSTYHSSLMALLIFLCCMLSPDYLSLFGISVGADYTADALNLVQYGLFVLFIVVVVIFFNFSYDLKMPLRRKAGYIAVCMASYAVFIALYFLKLHYIAFFIFMLVPVELSLYVSRHADCFNMFSFNPTMFLMFAVCGLIAINVVCSSGLTGEYPFGVTPFYFTATTFTYAHIYLKFVRLTQKRELANAIYRAEYERIKSRSLQSQIKPHFVFNVLSSIKNLYHIDAESGDRAIDLFSKHLRAQIAAANTDLIPVEKELDNVQIFIELENMRRQKDLNVVFDIEYSDFLIPALSLQPFIENAIKYSKIDEKADGYILISSHLEDDGVMLEIKDNGIGFDVRNIRPSSYGIRNSAERFRLLTGVSPEIVSSVGQGTSIKILFNNVTLGRLHENNNS